MSVSGLTVEAAVGMNGDVDRSLRERAHAGDPVAAGGPAHVVPAWHLAFDRCASGLHRFLAVRLGDAHAADDCMQQLWVQLARFGTHLDTSEVEPWLRTVARNLVRARWRQAVRRPASLPLADPALAADLARRISAEELPPKVLERREVREQLLLALTQLNTDEQELIVEHYFHARSHGDLAQDLGISERAVEGRLYRARQGLRDRLSRLEE